MNVLITRPEPDASKQADDLRRRGLKPIISPLLDVTLKNPGLSENVDRNVAGIIVTSRNALRAFREYPASPWVLVTPVFCVGPDTARMADQIGFKTIQSADGNANDLGQLIQENCNPERGTLLRLTGAMHSKAPQKLTQTLERKGFRTREIICYSIATASGFTSPAQAALTGQAPLCVILMSPLTAQTFESCAKADHLTIRSENIRYVCLSKAVAEALGSRPDNCKLVADKPNCTGLRSILDHAVAELS